MSKNNVEEISKRIFNQSGKYALRKLSVGVASVLIGTTMYAGLAHADTVPSSNESVPVVQASVPTMDSSKQFQQTIPSSSSNEIVNGANQNSVDQNNNSSSSTNNDNDQQNQNNVFDANNHTKQNNIVNLEQSDVLKNDDSIVNVKGSLYNDSHSSSCTWNVGTNSPDFYSLNMSFDIDAKDVIKGKRYVLGIIETTYTNNNHSLTLWGSNLNVPFVINGVQYGRITYWYDCHNITSSDHNQVKLGLLIDRSAGPMLSGLQHFSFTFPSFLSEGYLTSPLLFSAGQSEIDDPLVLFDHNGKILDSNMVKIVKPSVTYDVGFGGWSNVWFGATSAYHANMVNELSPFESSDDQLRRIQQGLSNDFNRDTPFVYQVGGHFTSTSGIVFDNTWTGLGLYIQIYHSDGKPALERLDYGQPFKNYKSVQLDSNLSLNEMRNVSYIGFGYSRQSDGSYNYLIKIPGNDLNVSSSVLKNVLQLRSWQIAADSNPERALQVTLDKFNQGLKLFLLETDLQLNDPYVSTKIVVHRAYSNYLFDSTQNRNSFTATAPIQASVHGQSTVKIHVISTSGADLTTVKSFTDWPNQNKHASLTIPSITGYELVSNPQSVLSALHLSGTAISSSVQVDYPAENTVADYYVVLQPKTESATVQIVDSDESNKVLATGTVSGRFGEQIVSNADIQSKLDSLIKTGYYVLASNCFDSGADYKDGTNTVTISLKHKLDSIQRHYRVIEDLPDGTKKVIVDYQITFYKDAASKYYNRMGAVTVDTLKLLKPNSVQMSVGNYSFPNDNTSVYSAIDKLPGYSYQMVDGINFNPYDNGVNCRILTNSQIAPLPPTTFNKADFKDLVFFDLFLGGSNTGGTDLISNLQNVGCVENPLASRDFHIEYSRNSYPVTVNYYDLSGALVSSSESQYLFADSVNITPSIPNNYVLAPGQTTHLNVSCNASDNQLDFIVAPKITVSTDSRTVTRTIKVQAPDGQTKNVVQTVTFVRNGYLNQVTKQTAYSPWSFNGQYQFSSYQPRPIDGYTVDVVPEVVVTPDSSNTTVNLVYHKQAVAYSIDYQLVNGTVVKNVSVTPGSNGLAHLMAPQGYRLLTSVTDVQVVRGSQKLAVLVAPAEQTYTVHDDLPSGVTEPLTKTVTRMVKIMMPNGHVRTVKQSVKFERTATVKADGTVVYSNWNSIGRAQFNQVFVPKRNGYRLVITDANGKSLADVEKINVVTAEMSDEMVNVKYVKD